jgi:hypothetical protein
VVEHTSNPSTLIIQEDCKFKASLGYIGSKMKKYKS